MMQTIAVMILKKIQTPILDGKLKIFFNDLVFLIFDAKVCIIFG